MQKPKRELFKNIITLIFELENIIKKMVLQGNVVLGINNNQLNKLQQIHHTLENFNSNFTTFTYFKHSFLDLFE